MNGLQMFTHATNIKTYNVDGMKDPEQVLEEIRDEDQDTEQYAEELEKALLYYAGFTVLDVEELYEQ